MIEFGQFGNKALQESGTHKKSLPGLNVTVSLEFQICSVGAQSLVELDQDIGGSDRLGWSKANKISFEPTHRGIRTNNGSDPEP